MKYHWRVRLYAIIVFAFNTGICFDSYALQNQTSSVENAAQLCDKHAAHPDDLTKPSSILGVADDDINALIAVQQCTLALQQEQNNPRIWFQVARAQYLYYTQQYGEAWFTGRARYWNMFEAAYRKGSDIAGVYFNKIAPSEFAKVQNELASREKLDNLAMRDVSTKADKNQPACSLERGRLFTNDEVKTYLHNRSHSGLTTTQEGFLADYRSDFIAIENREGTVTYQLSTTGRIFEGIAFIPAPDSPDLKGRQEGSQLCTFMRKPVATLTKCYQLIRFDQACPFEHGLFDMVEGRIVSLAAKSSSLANAQPVEDVKQRKFDLSAHRSQTNNSDNSITLNDPSQYALYAQLLNQATGVATFSDVTINDLGSPRPFVNVEEEIARLEKLGRFKDLPGGLYLSALFEGQFDVLKSLDKQAGQVINAHMQGYGAEVLGNFVALFSNRIDSSDEITRLYTQLYSEFSLIAPAMATYVLSFSELYPQCLGPNPVGKKVVKEFQQVLTDGYGFEIPMGEATRIESTYYVKQALGDILFKYSDTLSLAITGASSQWFSGGEGLSIQDINLGMIQAMRELSCDSGEAKQLETNLLEYWQRYDLTTDSYADRLRTLLAR